MALIDRSRAAELGAELVEIIERGAYEVGGIRVEIAESVNLARAGTVAYPPGETPSVTRDFSRAGVVEVTGETTLAAAKRLLDAGRNPVALNFASAWQPGGGFLSGARAQEESLCRASALYACLEGQAFYEYHHRQAGDIYAALYSDYALYSPRVPVLRDENENLLSQPWPLSYITMAAPNAKRLPQDVETHREILAAFETRIRKVLQVAVAHGHDAIILGAWGCGAFGNDSVEVAPIFARVLKNEFNGAFEQVTFAILDWSPERRFAGPFEEAF